MSRRLHRLIRARPPIMPETARRLRALLASPRSTHQDFEAVLLCDPAATLALYRAAERLRRGTVDELSGPAHALSLIGREAFRRALEQVPVFEGRPLQHILSPAFAAGQAAHAGWYAERIGQVMGFGHPVEMRVAALLRHPAVLALWAIDFEAAARATNALRDGVSFSVAFTAELGQPLKTVDRQLAAEWTLPRLAREVIGDWDPANRLPQSVSLAARLALVGAAGWPDEEHRLHIEVLSGLLPHHHHDAAAWWHRQAAEAARALHPFGYPVAAYELPRLPGGEEPVELPDLPSLRARKPAASASNALGERLRQGLQQAREATGCRRVLLAMPDRAGQRLRARLVLGGPADSPLRRLDLPLRQKHLFSLLLARPQAVWLRADNREKYLPLLRPLPLDAQSAGGFFALSLFVDRRPLGVLFADGGTLDAAAFRAFREAGRRLAEDIRALRRQAA